MTEVQQMKLATKRSLQHTHISQASDSGIDEGTGSIPGLLDVPTNESEEEIYWNSIDEEGDDDEGKDGDGDDDDDDGDDGKEGDVIRKLTDVNINKLHQPWRSFAAIINKCLTGKSSGYDSLWLSQPQILWGLYHKRNVDFAYLM
nr:hypothetical protein [Tanacetum cinerariifolium]